VLLPLQIFEERYRQLVRDLLAGPEPRQFGVIAIRKGRETGVDGISALHEIGCVAEVRQIREHEDGRYDLITAGAARFRLLALETGVPYLQGEAEMLPEELGDEAAAGLAARAVRAVFPGYLDALSQRGVQVSVPDVPQEPVLLSYLVAAAMVVDLPDKQGLLAESDAAARLAAERAMLARETTMLRSLSSTPAPDLRYSPYSSN